MYKVLIVDDEPNILEGLKCLLKWEDLGLEIAGQACNGLEAFELINSNLNINILITDIKMPKMNGLELIKRVRNESPNIKFIILSGYDDFAYVKEAAKIGIENYLLKPVDKSELVSTLENTIEKIEKELFSKVESREGMNILKDNVLVRWINNEIDEEKLLERSELLGIKLSSGAYLASVVKIINPPSKNGMVKIPDENLLRFAVHNICFQTIEENGSSIIFPDGTGDIAILFNLDEVSENSYQHYGSILQMCAENIKTYTGADVFITVGNLEYGYANVWRSYINAKSIQEYQLVTSETVIYYHKLERIKNNVRKNFKIGYKELYRLILEKDIIGAEGFIEEVYSRLKSTEGLTPVYIQNLTFEIIFYIINNAKAINPGVEMVLSGSDSFVSGISSAGCIDEVCEWVKDVARKCFSFLNSDEVISSPAIKHVLAYIDQNYAKDINLKVIASEIGMNANYLGQTFKNETGAAFTNYLNRIRIEKAKKLLIEEPVKAYEVSKAVGYTNSNYFYTLFKRMTGMSPTEYKDLTTG